MSKNVAQVLAANPVTTVAATDTFYLAANNTTDAAITGANLKAALSPLTTKGDLYTFSTVNARLAVAVGDGKILQVSSGAATGLAYSTPTYPSASGTAGTILRSDGTNNVYTTSTFADTYAVSTILYASSANTVSGLATANNATLTTNASGVPSWSTTGGINAFTNVTGTSATIAVNNGYISNNAGLVTLTLPATAAVGTMFAVQGSAAGGWTIAQNAGQILHVGSSASTAGAGGSVASSNRYNSAVFVCIVANLEWATLGGPQGNLTVV